MSHFTNTSATINKEWSNLLEQSMNLIPQNARPRVQRSLRGIESEAERLGLRSRAIPTNQMCDIYIKYLKNEFMCVVSFQ